MFKRPISCALSPNTEGDDVRLALTTMFRPWQWKKGKAITRIEQWFGDYFKASTVVSFNSGRSALLAILKSFDIGDGDDVLLQAFTCVAVPDAILWTGARPVFVDIDDFLNIDPGQIEKRITKKTKAIIVQHTFGIPAQMERIAALAKRHNILLIEDCAHGLGASYKGKTIGSLGDAAFFSFGRDKVISSVWGGVALVHDDCPVPNAKLKLKEIQKSLPIPNNFWIFQQLLHPVAFSVILRLYDVGIGKILLVLLQKLRLLSLPVYEAEKTGGRPRGFPAKFPNALAILLGNQLPKLIRYNQQRKKIARLYQKNLDGQQIVPGAIYLRYPFYSHDPEKLRQRAKKEGILLGNWYHHVIDPTGADLPAVGYTAGSCPKAEKAASNVVNLPTRISEQEARKVLEVLS